tara:strand:- start:285 stop:2255 length:1971 start_codon:yes stop_codon:yes gene_type:complete
MIKNLKYSISIILIFCFSVPSMAQNVKMLLQGDTQKMTDKTPDKYISTMEKTLTDAYTKDADIILQMGDITEDGKDACWQVAQQGWRLIEENIPFVLNIGNNDVQNGDQFTDYFPIDRYNKNSPFDTYRNSFVSSYDNGRNFAHHFNFGDVDWLIISIVQFPGNNEISWAEGLIDAHPDKKVIIVNHTQGLGDGNIVWNMVKKKPNVEFLFLGHNLVMHEILTADDGHKIGRVQTCWHTPERDHYYCAVELDTQTGSASFKYYSPLDGKEFETTDADRKPWSWTGFNFRAAGGSNAPNQATFVSQVSVPYVLGKGETGSVSVTMKNTGTTTWSQSGLYKLGSFDDNLDLGLTRVELDPADQIKPDEEKIFTFNITGPTTPGTFDFQWRMVQDNVEWFGDITTKQQVVVSASNNYMDNCDANTSWNSDSQLTLNTVDKTQGTAALEFSGSSTNEYSKVFPVPYDAMGSESGTVVQFWYYVSDPSQFQSSNQVEIGSSGAPDTNEYSWSLGSLNIGWNFIQLDVKNANKSGNPDLSAINWFRIYRFKSGSVTTRLDGIQLIGENSLGINDIVIEKSLKISPNPADSEIYVSFTISNSATVSIVLTNMKGQVILQKNDIKELNPGTHKLKIPIDTINSGIYLAVIKIDTTVFTKKIIIK